MKYYIHAEQTATDRAEPGACLEKKMETSKQKLIATIEKQSTEILLSVLRSLNLQTASEAILTCEFVTNELEKRLSESDFIALMNELDEELMSA
ncbi:MAG: hypothetical protein WC505_07900 [Patescibacteria group bacterium]